MLNRLSRLTRQDIVIAAEAIAMAIPIEIALRRERLDTLIARLGDASGLESQDESELDVHRATRVVEEVARFYPLNATCLKKSLILFRILRRRGVPVEFRLGVGRLNGDFASHAWLESRGRTLFGEGVTDRYLLLLADHRTR
jgi:hypothetical protein